MLIEFKVANFQCFRDEVCLNLSPAGRDKRLRGNIWKGHRYDALKSAAIFGPNASGKTSLLQALYVLRKFVRDSATRMNAGDPIKGVSPFRLTDATRKAPSTFEVLVEVEGVAYRYRVETTTVKVLREVLERQDATRKAAWLRLIDRDVRKDVVRLHARLGNQARRDQIVEDTRENALILSRAAERNVTPVLPLFSWFSRCIHHVNAGAGSPPDRYPLRVIAQLAAEDEEMLRRLSGLLRDADTGIVQLSTEEDRDSSRLVFVEGKEDLPSEAKEAIDDLEKAMNRLQALGNPSEEAEEGQPGSALRFFTEHGKPGQEVVRFNLSEESAGTLRYLRLVGLMLTHCATSDLLAVDELHTSLHPQLAQRVIQMAHSPEFGTAGAQMLFTTHDATLLDPNLLRRDQIFLTDKGPDGAAELYSLWDFEDMPRNSAAWARNYLAGRFGGVPVFGPSLADIPQADEPTPVQSPDRQAVEAE